MDNTEKQNTDTTRVIPFILQSCFCLRSAWWWLALELVSIDFSIYYISLWDNFSIKILTRHAATLDTHGIVGDFRHSAGLHKWANQPLLLRISLSCSSIYSTPAPGFYYTIMLHSPSACSCWFIMFWSYCVNLLLIWYMATHLPPNTVQLFGDAVIWNIDVGYYITYCTLHVTSKEERERERETPYVSGSSLLCVVCVDRLIWPCVDPISSWLLNWVSLLKLPLLLWSCDLWACLLASF